jgi:hypothetical protein
LCDWSRASSFRQPKCQIDESLSCVYISVKLVFNFSSQLETQLSTRPTISRAVKRKWFSIEIGKKNKTKIWERFLFYFLPTANEREKKKSPYYYYYYYYTDATFDFKGGWLLVVSAFVGGVERRKKNHHDDNQKRMSHSININIFYAPLYIRIETYMYKKNRYHTYIYT